LTSSSPTDFSRMLMALLHSLSASSNLHHIFRTSGAHSHYWQEPSSAKGVAVICVR